MECSEPSYVLRFYGPQFLPFSSTIFATTFTSSHLLVLCFSWCFGVVLA